MKSVRMIGRAIEQEARQLRGYFMFATSIKLQRQWIELDRADDPYDQTVLLDINNIGFDGEQGRRVHAMVSLLTQGGYRTWLTPRLCFFHNAKKAYKWRALEHLHYSGDEATPTQFDLCITDRRSECPVANRTVRLVGDTNRQLESDELPLPYAMHPDHLDNREDLKLSMYRDNPRRWRVFFGGYRNLDGYHCSEQYTHFKTVPRPQLIQVAEDCFRNQISIPDGAESLQHLMGCDVDGLTLLDASTHRVPTSQWLGVLSHANFFLAAPGSTYPMSHNCIESLAIGTIPILEYPEVFQPALEHRVNCLVYRGETEFRQLMDEIKSMPQVEIDRLRGGAMQYFDEHLSPQAFVRKLNDNSINRLHMYAYLALPSLAHQELACTGSLDC